MKSEDNEAYVEKRQYDFKIANKPINDDVMLIAKIYAILTN